VREERVVRLVELIEEFVVFFFGFSVYKVDYILSIFAVEVEKDSWSSIFG